MKPHLPTPLAVIGLGYVGLQLATAFGRQLPTLGFDTDLDRVCELQRGYDSNGEVSKKDIKISQLTFSNDPTVIKQARSIIVAVPTPVDEDKHPDLSFLTKASQLVGQNLSAGSIVVYESTVYPGCTEEVCIPILETASNLKAGLDFRVGYSPERVNPGDPDHGLAGVVKVVAGLDMDTTKAISSLYSLVATSGVYEAPNIRTAEAAKVIENIQRDLNIALMNEISIISHRLGLDTREILRAANTKWNFLPFEPGLVGGHCIPVDPYYLTHKAQEVGHQPEVIMAGRRINDNMGKFIAAELARLLKESGKTVQRSKVLVLGLSFKENVRDIRNSQVVALVRELESLGLIVTIHDPLVNREELRKVVGEIIEDPFEADDVYEAVVLAVPHTAFLKQSEESFYQLLNDTNGPGVLMDLKGVLPKKLNGPRLKYWSL